MRYQILTTAHKVKAQFDSADDLNRFFNSLPPEEQFFSAVYDTTATRLIPGFVYMSLSDEDRLQ